MKKMILTESQYFKLLTEAKDPHEIYNEYYSDIEYDDFYKIVKADPRTKEKKGKLKKIGKYAKILLDIYRDRNLRFEDLDKAHDYLEIAYNHNVPLPKEQINEISDIYHFVKDKIAENTYDLDTIISLMDDKDYAVIYNDANWLVATPETEKGACKLGAGTEWCTAHGEHAVEKEKQGRHNLYEEYEGGLFIFINKNEPEKKYQLFIDFRELEEEEHGSNIENPHIEMRDAEDDWHDISNVIEELQNPIELIKEIFEKVKYSHNLESIEEALPELKVAINISPEDLHDDIINEVTKDYNDFIKALIKGGVKSDGTLKIEEEIEENVVSVSIDEVHLAEDSDELGGATDIEFELNKDAVYDEGDETVRKLLVNAEIRGFNKSGAQPVMPPYVLEKDPALDPEQAGELIKEVIFNRKKDVTKDVDKPELYDKVAENEEQIMKYMNMDMRQLTLQFLDHKEMIPKWSDSRAKLFNDMDDIRIELKYDCFLNHVVENNIEKITTEILAKIFFECENDNQKANKIFSSFEEFFREREQFRIRGIGTKNLPTNGFKNTVEYLEQKVDEIVRDIKTTQETRKINRLMFYD